MSNIFDKSTLVSIIIPTHRPDHFRNALACALAQTYKATEIIVSDNSEGAEIECLCAQHPNIRYRRNPGGIATHNIYNGLSMARGDFIKYLFDDDLLYPHCIDSMLGWLDKLSPAEKARVGIVTASRDLIDDQSVVYEHCAPSNIACTQVLLGVDACKDLIVRHYNFIGEFSTVLFRRELIAGLSHDDFFSAFGRRLIGLIDLPLYLHILRHSNLLFIPYALSAFRLHDKGGSNFENSREFHYVLTDWFRLIQGAYEERYISNEEAEEATLRYIDHLDQDTPPHRFFSEQISASRSEAERFLADII